MKAYTYNIDNPVERAQFQKIYDTFFGDYDSDTHISHLSALVSYRLSGEIENGLINDQRMKDIGDSMGELEDAIYDAMYQYDKNILITHK